MSYWFGTTNHIENAVLTASSTKPGTVGHPIKIGTGSAVAETQGEYTGPRTRVYTIGIDSVTAGAEVGQAAFRWKHSDSAGWEAANVSTSSSWLTLEHGVQIKWTSGSGDDFVVGDEWKITCANDYGPGSLWLLNRDRVYRSTSLDDPNWLEADLGAAKQVEAAVLLDHNLTSGATITLKADNEDGSWASPDWSQALTWNEGAIVYFLDQTYRYWRLEIDDPDNPDGYIELGELFLGTGLSPQTLIPLGHLQRGVDASNPNLHLRQTFSFRFIAPTSSGVGELKNMFQNLFSLSERRLRPVFFCFDTGDPGPNTWLVEFPKRSFIFNQVGYDHYEMPVELIEARRSNV